MPTSKHVSFAPESPTIIQSRDERSKKPTSKASAKSSRTKLSRSNALRVPNEKSVQEGDFPERKEKVKASPTKPESSGHLQGRSAVGRLKKSRPRSSSLARSNAVRETDNEPMREAYRAQYDRKLKQLLSKSGGPDQRGGRSTAECPKNVDPRHMPLSRSNAIRGLNLKPMQKRDQAE